MLVASSRSLTRALLRASFMLVLLGAAACGDDAAAGEDDHDGAHEEHPDGGHYDDGHAEEGFTEVEPCTADYPSFSKGAIKAQAGDYTVTLLSLTPDPPLQRKDNDWVVEITDADGEPAEGAEVLSASPYMPKHMHGSRAKPTIEKLSEPGQYKLNDVDFSRMGGPWQVIVAVAEAGAAPSSAKEAKLQICVE